MLTALFFQIVQRSPKGRRAVFRRLFEYLARRLPHLIGWTQMNYGYASLDADPYTIALAPEYECERFCHQLYVRVVGGFDLKDRDVVEVSSGRGGGAAFLHRHLGPRSMTGIDIASHAVDFCRRVHGRAGLRFLQGDAEELPLFDQSADAIINVEASFCYGDMNRFLAEIRRVLKPGGHFFYADLRHEDELPGLMAALKNSGLELLETSDITKNVVRALELDTARREAGVKTHAPRLLRHAMEAFAGTPGSRIPTLLKSGQMRYLNFVLRKPRDVQSLATVISPVDAEYLSAEAA